MRTTPCLAVAVALLLLPGCGAPMTELVAEERWYDACDSFDPDDARYAEKSDFLMGELAARARSEVRTTVVTAEELRELLPHVPARMASGEIVLVATEASYESGPFLSFGVAAHPTAGGVRGRRFTCCEAPEWMDLDGRSEEWERQREAYERAREEARRRRARYSGRLGALRALGEVLAGAAADLTLIGTAGTIDVDVSDLPFARLSPIQAIRAVGERVAENVRSRLSSSATSEDGALAARRAESLAVLAHVLTGSARCDLGRSQAACHTAALFEMPQGQPVDGLEHSLEVIVDDEAGESCDVESTARSSLAAARTGQPLGAIFRRTAPPGR